MLSAQVSTGQPDVIETALITASKIATPIKEIEQRIMRRVAEENPGNNLACLPVIGFTDLKALAERVTRKQRLLADGKARFGDNIWETTPAETLCAEALGGAAYEPNGFIEDGARCKFRETPETNPTTLSECLHEIRFWDTLYDLRNAIDSYFDYPQVVWARKDFLFDLLAEIRPRSRKEASSVLDYLIKEERMDRSGVNDILRNLVR